MKLTKDDVKIISGFNIAVNNSQNILTDLCEDWLEQDTKIDKLEVNVVENEELFYKTASEAGTLRDTLSNRESTLNKIVDACKKAGWKTVENNYYSMGDDMAGFVEKQHAEIESLNEQLQIDRDFIKRDLYKVIDKKNEDESRLIKIIIGLGSKITELKARLDAAEEVVKQSWYVVNYTDLDNLCRCVGDYRKVLIKHDKLKAGAGSVRQGNATNVDFGNHMSGPATPQACKHQTCPECKPDLFVTDPDGVKRRIV